MRLAGQQPALAHAEPVLLVDDGQAEVFEDDAVGEHGVGADDQPGAAVGNGAEGDALFAGFHAADKQRDVDAERFQPVGQRGRMLAGQDLGGGQHRALPAVLRGKPDGGGRHQRFAAADIALQQAVHRRGGAQVTGDLLGGAALRPGGRVGQAAPERPQVQRAHRRAGGAAAVAAQQKDANLQQVQFLKDQAAAGGGQVGGVARGVHGAHGLRLARHAVARQQRGGQRVGQFVHIGQRRLRAVGVAGGGQALGARVDRHKGAGGHLGLGAHQRVQQLAVGQRAADAPLKKVALADDEFFGRVGRIEPRERQHAGIVGRQHAVQQPPALDAAGRFLLQHRRPDAAVGVIGGFGNGVGLRIVDVFARVAQQQVPHGNDAEFCKLFGKRRADALEVLDRTVEGGHWRDLLSALFVRGGSALRLPAPRDAKRTNRLQAAGGRGA